MTLIEKREHGVDLTGSADEPWFTRGAITFLENILTKDMSVLEYGCGTSTLWYSKRVKYLISIEHQKGWYDAVNKHLRDNHVKNVDLRCIDIHDGYVEAIDDMEEFDIISVDGRRRSDCIKHSNFHIKVEGYLLLDNAERKRYQDAIILYLSKWKRYDFSNKIWLTSIFQKVCSI